jgi:hypothetical protein
MKKIFAFVSILAMSSLAFAQDNGGSINKFRFGFKVAPSLAWLKPDIKGYDSDGSKIGFVYGAMMDYNFTKNYALHIGLEVSYRGGKLKYEVANNSNVSVKGTSTYNLKYIEIPFAIKMKTNEIGYMTYFGQFGFQPAFKIGAKADYESTLTNPSQTITTSESDVDVTDQVNSFNASLLFAIGVEYRISGNTSLVGAIQFSNGFTSVIDATDPTVNEDIKAITNYLSLNIGVFF